MVLNLELLRPKNHRNTSSKWLQSATLLIVTSYHKSLPVNFKAFFWTAFTTESKDNCFQIDKITFLYPEFLEIMGILRVAITTKGIVSPRHCIRHFIWQILIHYPQNFSKKKKKEPEVEDLELSIGCWNSHLQICTLF